ncbi:MAG: chemotaxis protein CheW [Phycisphaerales bacterium]
MTELDPHDGPRSAIGAASGAAPGSEAGSEAEAQSAKGPPHVGVDGSSTARAEHAVLHLLDRPIEADDLALRGELAARPRERRSARHDAVVVFRLGAELLGIQVSAVRRIMPCTAVMPIPHRTNDVVVGLCNVRGELVLAADLRRLLGIAGDERPTADRASEDAPGAPRMTGMTGMSAMTGIDPSTGRAGASTPTPTEDAAGDGGETGNASSIGRRQAPRAGRMMVLAGAATRTTSAPSTAGDDPWAVNVDDVLGVERVDPAQVRAVPTTVQYALDAFAAGIVELAARQVTLLDAGRVFGGLKAALR